MNKEKTLRVVSRVLDVLLTIVLLFIIVNTLNSTLIYREGYNLLEYAFEALTYLIIARIAILVPWKSLKNVTPLQGVFLLCSAAAFILFLAVLINKNFYSAVEAIIITRASFDESSDTEIARDITRDNPYYPLRSFVQEIQDTVPEGDGIAYIGDQRAHIMSYLLYPRRVYALPDMQIVLNEMIEENWTWSPIVDPFHPPKDPMNPEFQGYPQNRPSKEVQAEFLEMVEEKDIEWVIYYDANHPERSWLTRIEGSIEG